MAEQRVHAWESVVRAALGILGGEGHLNQIYDVVERLRKEHNLPLSKTWKATVRRTVQESPRITQDVKRSGVWRLVDRTPQEHAS